MVHGEQDRDKGRGARNRRRSGEAVSRRGERDAPSTRPPRWDRYGR
jgi:hypothetical protein